MCNESRLDAPSPHLASPQGEGQERTRFTAAQRLGGRGTFKAILDRGVRVRGGPINLCVARNDAATPRLGISIGRPVGNAVRRNRIKRLLRESFRLAQRDWPAVDIIVLVRPHAPLRLVAYQTMLADLVRQCLTRLPPTTSPPTPSSEPPAAE